VEVEFGNVLKCGGRGSISIRFDDVSVSNKRVERIYHEGRRHKPSVGNTPNAPIMEEVSLVNVARDLLDRCRCCEGHRFARIGYSKPQG